LPIGVRAPATMRDPGMTAFYGGAGAIGEAIANRPGQRSGGTLD
jgi:hypothetical protein